MKTIYFESIDDWDQETMQEYLTRVVHMVAAADPDVHITPVPQFIWKDPMVLEFTFRDFKNTYEFKEFKGEMPEGAHILPAWVLDFMEDIAHTDQDDLTSLRYRSDALNSFCCSLF